MSQKSRNFASRLLLDVVCKAEVLVRFNSLPIGLDGWLVMRATPY